MLNPSNRYTARVSDFRVIHDVVMSVPLIRLTTRSRDAEQLTNLSRAQVLNTTLSVN